MELIVITIIGYSLSTSLAVKIVYDCLYRKKMQKHLNEMKINNQELSESISNFQTENEKLCQLSMNMEQNEEQLKNELEQLKGIIHVGGEQNKEVYKNLTKLYKEYENVVDIDLKVKCIGLLTDLDTNNDFEFDESEREQAKIKLKLLFSEKQIEISDSDFDNLEVLKQKLYDLIKQ